MTQYKYDTYKYSSKTALLNGLEAKGYVLNNGEQGLQPYNTITDPDTGEVLNMTYFASIVTNYPETGEDWEAEFSSEVYVHCSRIGNMKLPSSQKLKGNDRKYFNNHINRFAGEEKVN